MNRLYWVLVRFLSPSAVSLVVLFSLAHNAPAQLVSFGVTGGARVSNDVFGTISSESKRYIVGPRLDLNFSKHFYFEADALYRNFGYSAYESSPVLSEIVRERANSWEIPLMIKYRYKGFKVHPFLGGGYDPRFVHGSDVTNGAFVSGQFSGIPTYTYLINQKTNTNYSTSNGIIATGGLEFPAGPIRISPEMRYIHWQPAFLQVNQDYSAGRYKYNSAHNELQVLFGITWH